MSREEEPSGKLDIRVKQVMTPNPLTADVNSTLDAAAKGMEKCDCGCCLVESAGKIVGIITERDIVRRVAAKGSSVTRTKVRSVMTSPVIVIHPEAPVEQALQVMAKNKVRRLPVVDEKGLVGIVTLTDIAEGLAEKSGYANSLLNAMARQLPPQEGVYA